MKIVLLIASGGALGAVLRWVVSSRIDQATGFLSKNLPVAPIGTLVVNGIGSLAIGLIFGVAMARGAMADPVRYFVVTGLLGSLTTFSTFSYHSFELLRGGFALQALANIALNVLLTLVLVALAYFVGQKFGHPV